MYRYFKAENQGILYINDYLKEFLLFYYFCLPFWVEASNIIGFSALSNILPYLILFFLYLFLCFQEKKVFCIEFFLLLLFVVIFFITTYILHPEYDYWFTRPVYGVWDYVLRPDNGIYIYLFIRIIDHPKGIIRAIKCSASPWYSFYLLKIFQAYRRGYWIDTSNYGYEIHTSYNLSLGYNLLLFTLVFLYCALEDKKFIDVFGTFIGVLAILLAGSRGPIVDIVIFLFIYYILKIVKTNSVNEILMYILVAIAFYLGAVFSLPIFTRIASDFCFSSRFIEKLLNGEISDISSRTEIWKAAIQMIIKRPFGYGAMGSRHVISKYIFVAHPHQIFLELLIDFGIFVGGIIIIWLLYYTIKLFTMKGNDEWKGLFLVFFARACQLLVSLTFWHSIGLWGAIAIGVCALSARSGDMNDYGNSNEKCPKKLNRYIN